MRSRVSSVLEPSSRCWTFLWQQPMPQVPARANGVRRGASHLLEINQPRVRKGMRRRLCSLALLNDRAGQHAHPRVAGE